jgi:hypothetical protein
MLYPSGKEREMQKEILDYVNSQPEEIRSIQKQASNVGFKVFKEPDLNFPSSFKSEILGLIELCKHVRIENIEALKNFTLENFKDSEEYFRNVYRFGIRGKIRWETTAAHLIELMLIKKFEKTIDANMLTMLGWDKENAECVLKINKIRINSQ